MQWFDIYAPLQEFCWSGDSFELSSGLWIKRFGQTPDLQGLNTTLGDDEKDRLLFANHWLTFRWNEGTEPSPAENVNLVLLSLWLAKPTKTHVAYRFALGPNGTNSRSSKSRLLDRFLWIKNVTFNDLDTADLQSAPKYYSAFRDILLKRGRLNDALILTLSGCCSYRWQVALICYAAAAETMLTYATSTRITRRLAIAYACLVETEPDRRNTAFEDFRALYSIRSDIMHGRAHVVAASDRLPKLAKFAEMIRRLWQVVICSEPLTAALEGSDEEREACFEQIIGGFSPLQ